jgi:Mg2+ and Co2+ transporter CorA
MKAITVLTMVFLPATFVCSLFSMGFFDFETSPSVFDLKVANQFWIYFAVAIPLTVLVLGICVAWLKWSGRYSDTIGEFPTK